MKRDTPPLNTVGAEGKPKKRAPKPMNRASVPNVSAMATTELADVVDQTKPLTDMQRRFITFWAQGENVHSAAARAGYEGVSAAYRIVHYPHVLALYAEEKAKYEESCQMTRKRVMEGLLEGVEMAKLEGEPMAVIAGWREVGRMCGYYEPIKQKIEINVTGGAILDRLNKLSDKELLDLVTAGVQTPGVTPLQLVDEVSIASGDVL